MLDKFNEKELNLNFFCRGVIGASLILGIISKALDLAYFCKELIFLFKGKPLSQAVQLLQC